MKFTHSGLIHEVFRVILLLAFCCALTATSVAQNQYFVNSSTGSDANDGSQARPWATLNHADSALSVGSPGTCRTANGWSSASGIGACVHVASGAYSGAIQTNRNGTASARIRYVSDTKYGARMVGDSSGIIWSVKGKFTDIVGFDFDGSVNSANFGAIVTYQGGENASILNNRAHNLANAGGFRNQTGVIAGCIIIGGVPLSVPCNNIYRSNLLYHNNGGGSGPTFSDGNTGLDLEWGDTAQDNIVMDQGGGYCIQAAHSATQVIVTNNTVLNCARGGIVIGFGLGGTVNTSTFTNNIVVNTGVGSNQGSGIRIHNDGCGAQNIYASNLVYGNLPSNYEFDSCSNTATGTQSGSNSATFVNYTGTISGDYHLKTGSTAIANATTACAVGAGNCIPPVDFEGNPISRSALDIGFLQSTVTSATGPPNAPTGLTATVN